MEKLKKQLRTKEELICGISWGEDVFCIIERCRILSELRENSVQMSGVQKIVSSGP
jgi:hypothetical protein